MAKWYRNYAEATILALFSASILTQSLSGSRALQRRELSTCSRSTRSTTLGRLRKIPKKKRRRRSLKMRLPLEPLLKSRDRQRLYVLTQGACLAIWSPLVLVSLQGSTASLRCESKTCTLIAQPMISQLSQWPRMATTMLLISTPSWAENAGFPNIGLLSKKRSEYC